MAVLEDIPGVEVTVRVAGEDAVEHDDAHKEKRGSDEHDTCPAVTRYIESIDDAEFAIMIAADRDYDWGYKDHSLAFTVRVDGHTVTRRRVSGPGQHVIGHKHAFCPRSQCWQRYKLRFSAVRTTDDPRNRDALRDLKTTKHLGLIEVVVERCIQSQPRVPEAYKRFANHIEKFELGEKLTKGEGISHGTVFSFEGRVKTPKHERIKRLPEDDGPIAVFRLLYRSREQLEKKLIVPRNPSPSPAQSFSELSPAEIELLARERFEQMQREEGLKNKTKSLLKRKLSKTEVSSGDEIKRILVKRLTKFD
ncbi:hypothetical protein SAMD00023353_1900350 [Rosellinia necatrix]|uniref:DUF7918 domain-containing protein n=1 Tax=Rosellinia necatrix TaxID=77044 RepID=A0A1S8A7T1_ROSNE|nr:hypothetical protein SAMD00023353_1900350 [Rosellinia necatrix]